MTWVFNVLYDLYAGDEIEAPAYDECKVFVKVGINARQLCFKPFRLPLDTGHFITALRQTKRPSARASTKIEYRAWRTAYSLHERPNIIMQSGNAPLF